MNILDSSHIFTCSYCVAATKSPLDNWTSSRQQFYQPPLCMLINWHKSPKLIGGRISFQYYGIVTLLSVGNTLLLGTQNSKLMEPKGVGTRSKFFNHRDFSFSIMKILPLSPLVPELGWLWEGGVGKHYHLLLIGLKYPNPTLFSWCHF